MGERALRRTNPHEFNFRSHPPLQRAAVQALYRGIGFARSLLAYELPDGRLKLIDGHLRRELDPELEVEVEVLDVNEEEARALLLSIDPLAALAQTQHQILERLLEVTPSVGPEVEAAWQVEADRLLGNGDSSDSKEAKLLESQFLVLITCQNETHQIELLDRFSKEGLECKALLS